MMSFLVLFGFGFPLCSLKISAPMFIICLLSSLIFLPIGIGIAKQNWILFGSFLAYYIILWPFVWWISWKIKGKKILNILMILFYIPQPIVGLAYASIYSLFNKKDHGIILFFMPYLQYMPKYEKLNVFIL